MNNGDQLEVNFMTGGPALQTNVYFVTDNQGNLITNGLET